MEEKEIEITPRKVKVYFKETYEFPDFKQEMMACYDPEKDIYILAQYTYCNDEEQLKKITLEADEWKKAGLAYVASLDEDGKPTEKKESLLEKVAKMKK